MMFVFVFLCATVNLCNGAAREKCELPQGDHPLVQTGICRLHIYNDICQLFCFNIVGFPQIGEFGKGIREIMIEDSNVTTLDKANFINTPNVEIIRMIYSNIDHVGNDTFSELHKLKYLGLSWNPFTMETMSTVVCSLPNAAATRVHLEGIFLTDLNTNFPDSLLGCLQTRNIYELDLSVNMMNRSQMQSIFCAAKGFIQRFSFHSISLKNPMELDKDFFKCFSGEPLRFMDLSYNALSKVSRDSFTYLANITSLTMSDCELVRYVQNANIFQSLHGLVMLDISQNNFRDFKIFSNAPHDMFGKLDTLDLSENRFLELTKFSKNVFPSLQKLFINGNKLPLGSVPRDFVYQLKSLKKLEVRNNILMRLNEFSFHSDTLEVLNISRMTIITKSISIGVFTRVSNLKTLILDWLNPNVNTSTDYQHYLDEFMGTQFQNLTMLRHLSLRYMNIFRLNSGMFHGTDQLSFVDLSHNSIDSIGEGTINNLYMLTRLHMDYNSIQSINRTSLPRVDHKLTLKLSYNEWLCDCSLLWFQELMDNNTDNIIIDDDRVNYRCASPPYMKGVKVMDFHLHVSVSSCITHPLKQIYYMMMYSSAAICFITLLFSNVYRFRWYVYYMYINTKARIRGYKALNDFEEFQYDAFVCYHNHDIQWVMHTLRILLENKHKLKLCLHDRDWLGGVDIVDNIQQSIEKSRKVVLIITNAFAKSNWCQFELTMAQHRLFSEDRDNLILVMKEKILDCYMTPRLALQLKTQTYIEWDESEMGQKVFWKRLVKAISGPGRSVKNRPIN